MTTIAEVDPRFPADAIPATLWSIICPKRIPNHYPIPYPEDATLKVLVLIHHSGHLHEINVNPGGRIDATEYDPPVTPNTPQIEKQSVLEIFGPRAAFINKDYSQLSHRVVYAATLSNDPAQQRKDYNIINALLFEHFLAAQDHFLNSDWDWSFTGRNQMFTCGECHEDVTTVSTVGSFCNWCGKTREMCACIFCCVQCAQPVKPGPISYVIPRMCMCSDCIVALQNNTNPNQAQCCIKCGVPSGSDMDGACKTCLANLHYCSYHHSDHPRRLQVFKTPQEVRDLENKWRSTHYNIGYQTTHQAKGISLLFGIIGPGDGGRGPILHHGTKTNCQRLDVSSHLGFIGINYSDCVPPFRLPFSPLVTPQAGSLCFLLTTITRLTWTYLSHIEIVPADMLLSPNRQGVMQPLSPDLLRDVQSFPTGLRADINRLFEVDATQFNLIQQKWDQQPDITYQLTRTHIDAYQSKAKELFTAPKEKRGTDNSEQLKMVMVDSFYTNQILFQRQTIEKYIELLANGPQIAKSADNNNTIAHQQQQQQHQYQQLLSQQDAAHIIAVLDEFDLELRRLTTTTTTTTTPTAIGNVRAQVDQHNPKQVEQRQKQYNALFFEYKKYCNDTLCTLSALAMTIPPPKVTPAEKEENNDQQEEEEKEEQPTLTPTQLPTIILQHHTSDLQVKHNMHLLQSIQHHQMQRCNLAATPNAMITNLLTQLHNNNTNNNSFSRQSTHCLPSLQPSHALQSAHNVLHHSLQLLSTEDDGGDHGDPTLAFSDIVGVLQQQLALKDQQLATHQHQLQLKDHIVQAQQQQLAAQQEQLAVITSYNHTKNNYDSSKTNSKKKTTCLHKFG